MKSRFIFIHCAGELTADVTVYKVPFGTSRRDKSLLSWFSELAKSTDYYFQRESPEVANYIYRLAQSMFPDAVLPVLYLSTLVVTPSLLKKWIQTGFYPRPTQPRGTSAQLSQLDTHFYIKNKRDHDRE